MAWNTTVVMDGDEGETCLCDVVRVGEEHLGKEHSRNQGLLLLHGSWLVRGEVQAT